MDEKVNQGSVPRSGDNPRHLRKPHEHLQNHAKKHQKSRQLHLPGRTD
jgi:hypothetical protein